VLRVLVLREEVLIELVLCMQTIRKVEPFPFNVLDGFPTLHGCIRTEVPNNINPLRVIINPCLLVIDELVVYEQV